MTAPSLLPYYHVGIVVPDIAAAKVELSRQLGVTWGPILPTIATAPESMWSCPPPCATRSTLPIWS